MISTRIFCWLVWMIYNGIQSFVTFMLTCSTAAQRSARWPVKNELSISVAFPGGQSPGAVVSPAVELNWGLEETVQDDHSASQHW